jgi:hypothetical protein
MLQQRGDAMHCTVCGREYDAQDEDLVEGGECPSDDCPSNDDEGPVLDEVDAGDVFDIEYDH